MNYAFFDVDNTVLNFKSMFRYQDFFYSHTNMYSDELRIYEKEKFNDEFNTYFSEKRERLFINKKYYEHFKGRSKTEVMALAERCYQHEKDQLHQNQFWILPVLERMRKHKERGDKIVLISGSCYEILAPLIIELKVDECLATNLEVVDDIFTGNILGRQIIGENKGVSIKELAEKNSVDLKNCTVYGDHISDLSMHQLVGHPVVVEGDKQLEQIASENKWEVIRFKQAMAM